MWKVSHSHRTLRLPEELARRLQAEQNLRPESVLVHLLDMAASIAGGGTGASCPTGALLLEKVEESLERQRQEREDAIDMFLDGLKVQDESQPPRRPQEVVNDLSDMLRVPLQLSRKKCVVSLKDPPAMEVVREQVWHPCWNCVDPSGGLAGRRSGDLN